MRIPISMADPAIVQEMGSKRDPMLSSNNPTRVKIAPGKQVMLQDWQSSRPTVICTCSLLCRADAGPLEIIQNVAFIFIYVYAYGCAQDYAYFHAYTFTYTYTNAFAQIMLMRVPQKSLIMLL